MASYYSLKNIKINIEYEGKIKSTEIPPYKPISYIKEIAMELFNSIQSEIKIFFCNQDISEYKEYIIGDFFKRKKVINIKIEELNPKINNLTNNKKSKINKTSLICKCFRDQITNYCRNCKEFICNTCRINSIHLNHKITQVDIDNLVESVKLYAITLESEIPLNLHKIEENNNKCEKNKKQNDIKSRHEIINEKIDNVLNVYNNYMEHLNDENDNLENIINDYNSETYNISLEIEDIINEINEKYIKEKKKMNENEFKEYFRTLSEKEEPLKVQSYNIIPFCVNDDIKLKMKNMYDKIGEILDLALNSDSPLGISNEINDLYNFVLLHQKDDEEEEKKNNEIEEKSNNNEEYENNDNINENNNNKNENNEKSNEENENDDDNNEGQIDKNKNDENGNNIEQLKDASIQKNEDENSENKLNDVIDIKSLEEKEKNNLKQNGNINSNEKAYIENKEIDEQKPL
jgi:hypothetical protein